MASGDVWGWAEVQQIATVLKQLNGFPTIEVSAILLNKSKLYCELSHNGIATTVYDEKGLRNFSLLLMA